MEYWDFLSWFHEQTSKKYPSVPDGMKAFHFLRSFFEKMGCKVLHRDHPLNSRLSGSTGPASYRYARADVLTQ